MTAKGKVISAPRGRGRNAAAIVSYIFTLGALLASLFLSDEISHAVKSSLSLCATVIIPSVFPFIILSDILFHTVKFDGDGRIPRLFRRIFRISGNGVSAFMMGAVCGFPLGVKCTGELYRDGKISRSDAEKLIGFSNNTGPAFIVSGIGLGLRGNISDGIILYTVMIASAVAVGIIFPSGKESKASPLCTSDKEESFDLIDSIKNAALNTLYICAFLTFFAPMCTFLRLLLGESTLYLSLIPFIEVGSAASILSKTSVLSRSGSLALTAFAVCFSGFSVHLQAISFINDTNIRVGKYFLMKLSQGLIAAFAVYLICILK